MNRRNFLRTGGLAALGALAVPSLAMPASVRRALVLGHARFGAPRLG